MGSNHRSLAYEANEIPLLHSAIIVGTTRIELVLHGPKSCVITIILYPNKVSFRRLKFQYISPEYLKNVLFGNSSRGPMLLYPPFNRGGQTTVRISLSRSHSTTSLLSGVPLPEIFDGTSLVYILRTFIIFYNIIKLGKSLYFARIIISPKYFPKCSAISLVAHPRKARLQSAVPIPSCGLNLLNPVIPLLIACPP